MTIRVCNKRSILLQSQRQNKLFSRNGLCALEYDTAMTLTNYIPICSIQLYTIPILIDVSEILGISSLCSLLQNRKKNKKRHQLNETECGQIIAQQAVCSYFMIPFWLIASLLSVIALTAAALLKRFAAARAHMRCNSRGEHQLGGSVY